MKRLAPVSADSRGAGRNGRAQHDAGDEAGGVADVGERWNHAGCAATQRDMSAISSAIGRR